MERDLLAKEFYSDNRRFADLVNGIVCQGKQVVNQQDMSEWTSETKKGRHRDLVRKTAFGVNFAVMGLENQEEIDYLLSLRIQGYETEEYERQAARIRKAIRNQKRARENLTPGEYLYGFRKESRLHPVITIVLYYGKVPWDGATDLHGILDFQNIPEEFRNLVQNYQIHLVEVRRFQNTPVFQTDIRQVFDFIRYSEHERELKQLIMTQPGYAEMEEDAYDFVAAYTKATQLIKEKEALLEGGKINMCKGLDQMLESSRREGLEWGLDQEKRATISAALKANLPVEQIAEICRCKVEFVNQVRMEG